jgi:hypothetical protein
MKSFWLLGVYPPPPGPVESEAYAGQSTEIFGFKRLIGKIFPTKDLAYAALCIWEHAQRVIYNLLKGE